MVSEQRKKELAEITNIEKLISDNVKEEKESRELFSREDIEIKTDLSEEEVSYVARLKFLCDELGLDNFHNALRYLMELRLSKGRKSRKEFIEALGKHQNQFMMSGGNNMGGFNGINR